MLRKPTRGSGGSMLIFGLKAIVTAELVCVFGSYLVWRKMNTSQDFRYKVYQRCPSCLEVYYQMGERLGGLTTRQMDYRSWGIQKE